MMTWTCLAHVMHEQQRVNTAHIYKLRETKLANATTATSCAADFLRGREITFTVSDTLSPPTHPHAHLCLCSSLEILSFASRRKK